MERYNKIFESNRRIIDTHHSLDRYIGRYSSILSTSKMNKILQDCADDLITDYGDKEGVYGFHSKSTGAGGVINWRKDTVHDDGKNHVVIVSLFPIKKFHNFKDVDGILIVEQQLLLWAKEKGYTGEFKVNLCESYFDKHDNIQDEVYVSFFEGKLYDFKLDGYLIVD